ncbi:MAG: class I SAM-dependent methyltransferase [Chloroflexi bacterium]|nr:class I SAM-dependent methyltransferase [Chloroflexota bacterium]
MTITRDETVEINRKGWDKIASLFYGGTALPRYGPLAVTEDQLHLIDDLTGKAVLEIGCGSGHSLEYLYRERNAAELWGLDLSPEQIRFSREFFDSKNIKANLVLGSMDENPGIPENHFDCVVSIYSLGWTPDLPRTFELVNCYLKSNGVFIFSWEHPAYRCLSYKADSAEYVFTESYLKDGPEIDPSWKGVEIVLHPRVMSTYINRIIQAGLVLERLIESDVNMDVAREQDYAPDKWYSVPRAKLIPTTFIVKARKPK